MAGFTCGSSDFLKSLHSRLRKLADISGGTMYNRNKVGKLYYSIRDCRKLYKFMYNTENNLFLSRKKKVFDKYFEI